MQLPGKVTVVEVGPRDGLQNVRKFIDMDKKVALIDALSMTGLEKIEATAFVHPRAVPQMRDASEVMQRIKRNPKVKYSALVPNERGLQRAIESNVDEVTFVISISETFNRKNLNMTIQESINQLKLAVEMCSANSISIRADISAAFGCPFEGKVEAKEVINLIRHLKDLSIYEITLCDTTGMANPLQVAHLLNAIHKSISGIEVAVHFHNFRGIGLANVLSAIQSDVTMLDTSVNGIGGCPFAPEPTGNVATEDVVYMLNQMDIDTGIDLDSLFECVRLAKEIVMENCN